MTSSRWTQIAAIAACLLAPLTVRADPAALEFFETTIRPILAENCYECHGPQTQKSGLRLDHISTILAGGERGPEIVPGRPLESRLITAVQYQDPDLQMPPKRRLHAQQVAALEKWVAMGAPWPDEPAPGDGPRERGFDIERLKAEHWAWRPVARPSPPAVRDSAWPRDGLDHFVLAKLEVAGLRPAPAVGKAAWLRRVYFDLVGLPPEPAAIERFLADTAEDAHERIVDELLRSPRFGERWARHWMDLLRYSETYGHEFDYPIAESWQYRDYLIRALNADVPYDQLVREHIAGDLLVEPRRHPAEGFNESIIATGSWFLYEQTHAPTDLRQHHADRIDNQIDVMSKTFLGLTVACARCHDHKFDAISTADYYAMAGYLRSSRQQYAMLDPAGRIAQSRQQLVELFEKAAGSPAPAMREASAGRDESVFASFDEDYGGWTASGFAFTDRPTREGDWGGVLHPRPVRAGVAHSGLLGRRLHGVLRSPSFTITQPRIFIRAAGEGAGVKLRIVVDDYIMDAFNALLFNGLMHAVNTDGQFKWFTVERDYSRYIGHRAHIEVIDEGDGWIAVDEVRFGDGEAPDVEKNDALPAASDERREAAAQQMRQIDDQLPAPMRVLAMTEGTEQDSPIYIRGSHRSPGPVVPRRFLEAMGGAQARPIERGSGRLDLAARIADPDNPFTARVAVNRLWHHLVGRGIVASVDNFGVLGQGPSHPQLLDYLADQFVLGGWSQKAMIRRIVLSQTYRMASTAADEGAERADPTNVLLHRMNIKRLEGEVIRDAVLSVSGRLDSTMFGPSVPVYLTDFMTGRGRPRESGPIDGGGRRSVYQEVRRNFLSPFMLAFDTPTPFTTFGQRTISNVPAQALILMNDPFIVDQSRLWAKRVLKDPALAAPRERIEQMYIAALARRPTRQELTDGMVFIERQARQYTSEADPWRSADAWADLAHVLLNTKEFIFIP